MNEAQWLACNDPAPMLEFLRGRASDRKSRLFAVACCQRIWSLLTDERSRKAVEVAEKYADGLATRRELSTACDTAAPAWGAAAYAADAAASVGGDDTVVTAMLAADAAAYATEEQTEDDRRAEEAAQCHFLRDLIGNPFRPPPVIDAAMLAWNGGAVVQLARDIYEGNAWDRLPELGRMLEQAGCQDQDILAHCRQQGQVHVRGCWLVDLLLQKE